MSTPNQNFPPAAQAAMPATPDAARPLAWGEPLESGASIGDRHIVRRVSDSRFGTRYLALDPRRDTDCMVWCFDRVAGDLGPDLWAHLKKRVGERRPHVLPIDAIGRERGGLCWAATPFVGNHAGIVSLESLRIARGGAMTMFETVRALEQLLDASARSHDAGLVHGVIDPECVLVTPRGTLEVAMYGLARSIDARRDDDGCRADEVRSIAAIGWRLLTGSPSEDESGDSTQVRMGDALRAWLRRADDTVGGFDSAEDALRALPAADAGVGESKLVAARSLIGRLSAAVGMPKRSRADAARKNTPSAGVGPAGDR